MARTSIALVGLGKIARDQHLPALAASTQFDLAAIVGPVGIAGAPRFDTIADMMRSGLRVDAVVICTPPQVRAAIAHAAIDAGLHVMLEKPPAADVAELEAVCRHARERRVSLFTAWHSQFAPRVAEMGEWLAQRPLKSGRVTWREDAHKWHPGQQWLWQAGGPGVFDCGINAFAILTRTFPASLQVTQARFEVPANAAAPIAVRLQLAGGGASIEVEFDFREQRSETWEMELHAVDGAVLHLAEGGSRLAIDGVALPPAHQDEYPLMYRRFAELIEAGSTDCDADPLRLFEQAVRIAQTVTTEPFEP